MGEMTFAKLSDYMEVSVSYQESGPNFEINECGFPRNTICDPSRAHLL